MTEPEGGPRSCGASRQAKNVYSNDARCVVLFYCVSLLACVTAQIQVLSPPSLVQALKSSTGGDTIIGSTATFGAPTYGSSFIGRVYFAPSPSDYCSPDYGGTLSTASGAVASFAASPEAGNASSPVAFNGAEGTKPQSVSDVLSPLTEAGRKTAISSDLQMASGTFLRKIVLVPRGSCTFVAKALAAQALGADAVLLFDFPSSAWTRNDLEESVVIAGGASGRDVHIPLVMITFNDGQLLKNDIEKNHADVLLRLQWATLAEDQVVSVDFWMDGGTVATQRFLQNFAASAISMGPFLRFTPHYVVFDLYPSSNEEANAKLNTTQVATASHAGDSQYPARPSPELCWVNDTSICSNPSDWPESLVTGRMVLEEEARQLCLWQHTARENPEVKGSKYSPQWWEYVSRVTRECSMVPRIDQATETAWEDDNTVFGESCSLRILNAMKDVPVDRVRECFKNESWKLLSIEKSIMPWRAPTLRINGARYTGDFDVDQVLHAICSGFVRPPDACEKLASRPKEFLKPIDEQNYGSSEGYREHKETAPSAIQNTRYNKPSHRAPAIIYFGGLAGLVVGALYFYQRFFQKLLRAALHREVALEVRSQIQEYHRLEELPRESEKQRLGMTSV